jgi:hypothetical protein
VRQLAGLECAICDRPVDSVVEGRFCAGCDQPVHKECSNPPVDPVPLSTCRACGARLGQDDAAPASQPQNDLQTTKLPIGGGIVGFYVSAADYITPDASAVQNAGDAGLRHAAYHKRIVLMGGFFGLVGAALAVAISLLPSNDASGRGLKLAVMGPLMFGAAGILFGVAVTCLCAPQEFLTGPVGSKWLRLIGTKSVPVARFVCLLFGLAVVAPFVILGLMFALAR